MGHGQGPAGARRLLGLFAAGSLTVCVVLAVALVAACRQPPAEVDEKPRAEILTEATTPADALRPLPLRELPLLLDDGDRASLERAVTLSRNWLAGRPPERRVVVGQREVTIAEMRAGLDRVLGWLERDLSSEELAAEMAAAFEVVASVGKGDGEMLVTGYYEPVIAGSLQPGPGYPVPIYGPPPGIVRVDLGDFAPRFAGERIAGWVRDGQLVPLPTRRELRESGLLAGREIAWAKDPVDAFFLEIQGSGALRLPDGGELRIGYAGANGHPYRSIGKLLVEEGAIPAGQVSMQSIRAWLAAHPGEVTRVLDHNASKVFFRKLSGPPEGSLGFPVTAGRTIATDHRLFPSGALAFLVTEIPAQGSGGTLTTAGALRRFVLNQDTGGAIRGAARVDFFWGRGEEAAHRAGLMQQPGRLYFLVPKAPPETLVPKAPPETLVPKAPPETLVPKAPPETLVPKAPEAPPVAADSPQP